MVEVIVKVIVEGIVKVNELFIVQLVHEVENKFNITFYRSL